jgi:hypothetical protein
MSQCKSEARGEMYIVWEPVLKRSTCDNSVLLLHQVGTQLHQPPPPPPVSPSSMYLVLLIPLPWSSRMHVGTTSTLAEYVGSTSTLAEYMGTTSTLAEYMGTTSTLAEYMGNAHTRMHENARMLHGAKPSHTLTMVTCSTRRQPTESLNHTSVGLRLSCTFLLVATIWNSVSYLPSDGPSFIHAILQGERDHSKSPLVPIRVLHKCCN